jgi:hypothetical protein
MLAGANPAFDGPVILFENKPADREQDHLRFKLAPLEQTGNGGCEDPIGSAYPTTPRVATLPS